MGVEGWGGGGGGEEGAEGGWEEDTISAGGSGAKPSEFPSLSNHSTRHAQGEERGGRARWPGEDKDEEEVEELGAGRLGAGGQESHSAVSMIPHRTPFWLAHAAWALPREGESHGIKHKRAGGEANPERVSK
jgi:hypothetical protein